MEELKQRIEMLQECGFVDESGKADLYRIVEILQKHGIDTNDDNTGVLVTHVAAALKRSADGEIVTPLEPDVLAQVKEIENYDKAVEIQQEILNSMTNKLSADEQDFVLVHVGTILESV